MPKATAGAIIYREDSALIEILLTRRNIQPFKDYWCLPGGHIEQFEKAETAVIREVKEETNLDFSPQFLCYLDEIFLEMEIHNVVMIFFGTATNTPKADPGEVSDLRWFQLEETLKMDLAFSHNAALRIFKKQIGSS
jgi:8-oxo-dGTP diphosphatase